MHLNNYNYREEYLLSVVQSISRKNPSYAKYHNIIAVYIYIALFKDKSRLSYVPFS